MLSVVFKSYWYIDKFKVRGLTRSFRERVYREKIVGSGFVLRKY